jgi:hypothetical protein
MSDPRVQLDHVLMSFTNAGGQGCRAEAISRLTLDHVQRLMDAHCPCLPAAVLEDVHVDPVRVSLDAMDDDEVARASAAAIYRALSERL